MSMAGQWELLASLPFVIAGAGLLYILIVAVGGTALRLKRRQRERELDAERRETSATPWSEWLREINDRTGRDRFDDPPDNRDPTEKWRE